MTASEKGELKTRYPSQEIVEDRSSNMGIRLLTM